MKVLNFGSLNYDFVYQVDHAVIPGETISSKQLETFCGGKGLNQSIALARAGVPIMHAGLVGEDGEQLLELCRNNKVDATYIEKVEGKSGHAIIQLDKEGQNCILLFGGANRCITRTYIDKVLLKFKKDDILVVQNEISELSYLIDQAFEKGMQIVLNPSPYDETIDTLELSKISYFIINEIEGWQITGEKDEEAILGELAKRYPNSKVVLTLGSKGAIYQDAQTKIFREAQKVKVVDTTAAGDTFLGYFVAGLTKEMNISDILEKCVKASARAVTIKGATDSIPLWDEV